MCCIPAFRHVPHSWLISMECEVLWTCASLWPFPLLSRITHLLPPPPLPEPKHSWNRFNVYWRTKTKQNTSDMLDKNTEGWNYIKNVDGHLLFENKTSFICCWIKVWTRLPLHVTGNTCCLSIVIFPFPHYDTAVLAESESAEPSDKLQGFPQWDPSTVCPIKIHNNFRNDTERHIHLFNSNLKWHKTFRWRDPPSAVFFLSAWCFVSLHVEIYWTSDFYTVINFYGWPLLSEDWLLCTSD